MMYFCGCWGLSVSMYTLICETKWTLEMSSSNYTSVLLVPDVLAPIDFAPCWLLPLVKKKGSQCFCQRWSNPLFSTYIKLVWSGLHVCHYTWMLLRLLPSATSSLHNWLVLEKVEELYSQEKKVTFHVCRLFFFLTNHKRKTWTNLLFFHTLFTENNADLAVTQ